MTNFVQFNLGLILALLFVKNSIQNKYSILPI